MKFEIMILFHYVMKILVEVHLQIHHTTCRMLTLHDVGPYYIETSPLICSASLWTGFYMIGTYVMKE